MSQPEQIILTCPACGGRLRAPRSAVGTSVGCPSCQAAVQVREAAAFAPSAMIVDPSRRLGVAPRGESSPVADAAFKERLRSTTEDGFKVDPDRPVMIRRDHRRLKHGDTLTDWDTKPRRRHHHSGSRRLIRVLVGSIMLLALALGGIFWQRVRRPASDGNGAPGQPAAVPLELQATGDFRSEVWKVIQQFCAAPDAEGLIPFIRDPERVGPNLLRFYGGENPWTPLALGPQPDLSVLEVHRNFVMLKLPLADFGTRPIALEQTPEGFRIDWESFTGYSDLSWAELRRTRPREPVVLRAVIRPSDYFNRDFNSAATHRSFQISDLNHDHVLYGYVPLNSDAELQIEKVLLHDPSVYAVIRVRYPENSTNDRQLEITEVLEKGWIFRDDDLPEAPPEFSPADLTKLPVQATPGNGSTKPAVLPGLTSP